MTSRSRRRRPHVLSSAFQWQSTYQRLEIKLDVDPSRSLGYGDLVLENLSDGSTIPTSKIGFFSDTTKNLAVFQWPSYPNKCLPNGLYRATLRGSEVGNAAGTPIGADYVTTFFFVNGDANHDGTVDVSDLGALATNWQKTTKMDYTTGDFNFDGKVDATDLGILALNWQASVATQIQSATASGFVELSTRGSARLRSAHRRLKELA